MMSHQAEMNRDRKKRKKPFSLDEFYLYGDDINKDRIDPVYGATAIELIKIDAFPHWALFVYKELMERAEEGKPAEILSFEHEDAIIIAPVVDGPTCKGMLIAKERASSRVLEMKSPCGSTIRIRMPVVNAKVIAEENCYVDVI